MKHSVQTTRIILVYNSCSKRDDTCLSFYRFVYWCLIRTCLVIEPQTTHNLLLLSIHYAVTLHNTIFIGYWRGTLFFLINISLIIRSIYLSITHSNCQSINVRVICYLYGGHWSFSLCLSVCQSASQLASQSVCLPVLLLLSFNQSSISPVSCLSTCLSRVT